MPLIDHDKRAAIADKYGWQILGWAVDLHNTAGITLQSKYDGAKFHRFQHEDSLKVWESTLKANSQIKPKGWKIKKPKAKTFDEVVAENNVLKAQLLRRLNG